LRLAISCDSNTFDLYLNIVDKFESIIHSRWFKV